MKSTDAFVITAFGDSTTAPRGSLTVYAQILQARLEMRHGGGEIKVVNLGVPGNTTDDARIRFERDVLARSPHLAIIGFGINDSAIDVWKTPPSKTPRIPLAAYKGNLSHFVKTLKGMNAAVIIMTPNMLRWTQALKEMYGKPPYDPNDEDGFNIPRRDYAEAVRQIASAEDVALVDVYRAFEQYGLTQGKSTDDLLLDGMHPNGKGHNLMANLLLGKIAEMNLAVNLKS